MFVRHGFSSSLLDDLDSGERPRGRLAGTGSNGIAFVGSRAVVFEAVRGAFGVSSTAISMDWFLVREREWALVRRQQEQAPLLRLRQLVP